MPARAEREADRRDDGDSMRSCMSAIRSVVSGCVRRYEGGALELVQAVGAQHALEEALHATVS
jgi:hypothetical protein